MAKKKKRIIRIAKIQFKAGEAKPGPELAGLGINMPQFCLAFNNKTKTRAGDVVPVVITAYEDKSFDFVLKTTPTSILLLKALNKEKGASNSKTDKIGSITIEQLKDIAKIKMPDLNTTSIDKAIKIVEGTAKNMGIIIGERND